ncbi:MAG: efflux transporter outer membrane subunit [Burkholderiaceae bacterium]
MSPLRSLRPMMTASVCAAVLAACASPAGLAPSGHLRDADSAAATRTLADTAGFAAAWPSEDWWRGFGDPQLDALIEEALAGSPDMEIADARVRQAAAQAGLADAARQPTVGARAGLSGTQLPEALLGDLGGHFKTSGNVILNASIPFALWGARPAAWEAAVGAHQASEVDRQAVRLTLSAGVARAYVALGYAFQSLDLARADRDRAVQLHALTLQRVTAGLDSQAQLRQAETAEASAGQKLEQASMNVDSARLRLAALLGAGPDRALTIEPPRPIAPARLPLPADLPANLVGRRPDIVAARWRVQASRRAIDSARADFYPNFNLGAYAGLAGRGLGSLLSADGVLAVVSPAVSLPVFDGGRLRANLADRNAAQDLAVAQYNKTLVAAFNEVAEQVHVIRSLQRQVDEQRRAIDAARRAWELTTLRYRRGVGSYLETLSVQQALLTAEAAQAQLEQRRLDAAITLIQALGGGYHDDASPAPLAAGSAAGRTR